MNRSKVRAAAQNKPPFGGPRLASTQDNCQDAREFLGTSEVQNAVKVLRKAEGVVGVAGGLRQKNSRWRDKLSLTVFVHTKWAPDRLKRGENFKKRFPKIPIDVIEVGVARTATLTAGDLVLRTNYRDRSAITALLYNSEGIWVLACGHGVTPNGVPTVVKRDAGHNVYVSDDLQRSYSAAVYSAEFSGEMDTSLLLVTDAPSPDTRHPLTGTDVPFSLRVVPPTLGTYVYQFSPNRRRRLEGMLVAYAGTEPLTGLWLTSPSGQAVFYPQVFVVAGQDESFAEPGDSGSLVMDSNNLVVGTIVGVSGSVGLGLHKYAFILPLAPDNLSTRSQLSNLGAFFV